MNTPTKRPGDDDYDLPEEEPVDPGEEPCPEPIDPPVNTGGGDEYAELGGDDDTPNW